MFRVITGGDDKVDKRIWGSFYPIKRMRLITHAQYLAGG